MRQFLGMHGEIEMQGHLSHQDIINKATTLFENFFRRKPGLAMPGDLNLNVVVDEIPKEFRHIAEKVVAALEKDQHVMSRWQLNAAFTIAAKSLPRAPLAPAKTKDAA